MANIKSQIKRNRQNEQARLRNKSVRSALKTYARRVRESVAAGDQEAAEAALRRATRAYDRAASKGVIHKNNAANHKARLARSVNQQGRRPPTFPGDLAVPSGRGVRCRSFALVAGLPRCRWRNALQWGVRELQLSSVLRAATNASWGTSTRPICFIRRLPSFWRSSSLRLRVTSPP